MLCPPSPIRLFAAVCAFIALGVMTHDAHAQASSALANAAGSFSNSLDSAIKYKVQGLGDQVYVGNPLNPSGHCPFGTQAQSKDLSLFQKASEAGDQDKCPVAVVVNASRGGVGGFRQNQTAPIAACASFYQSLANIDADYTKPLSIDLKKIALCHIASRDARGRAVGSRNDLLGVQIAHDADIKSTMTKGAQTTGTAVQNLTDEETRKKIEAEKEAENKAVYGCFSDTLGKIESYWANKGAVNCVINGRQQIKEVYNDFKRDLSVMSDQCKAHFSRQVVGLAASVAATANGVLCVIEFAAYAANVALKVKEITDWIQRGCREGSLAVREYNDWRKTTLNAVCQSAANYIERAFTQCIRVDVGFNLNLPRFRILMQCPWNVNVSYRLGNNGFRCFQNGSIRAGFNQNLGLGIDGGQFGSIGGGRGNMMSRSGGMEALFDGSCFEQGEAKSRSGGTFDGLNNYKEDGIPGLSCGELSNDPKFNTKIAGQKPLQSGFVQNGWVAGPNPAGTETIDGVQITRCDYFQSGRRIRTAYVYGNGAVCNNTLGAFKDANGKEANTACYKTGGYEPAPLPSVPDGCLYPRACLDNAGNFSSALQGTNGCPANAQPQFSDANQYFFNKGGVGATSEWRSCEGMNVVNFDPAPACCDPQMQNCVELNNDLVRKKQPKVPLCKCNEGTANNKPDPNKQDGSCLEGGVATCCASSLNKVKDAQGNVLKDAQGRDLDGCTTAPNIVSGINIGGLGLPQTEVCRGEAPSCLAENQCGKFKAPDGTEKRICPNQVAISKPSPYMYLFIRPDAQIPSNPDGSFNPNAPQCCTTKWCNICPQHYANAYGLSMARATNISVVPYGTYSQSQYDRQINDAIIGRGWPFVGIEDEYGAMTYKVGRTSLPYAVSVYYDWNGGNRKDGGGPLTFVNPEIERGSYPHKNNNWRRPAQLMVSDALQYRWLPPSFDACNRLPGSAGKWKVSYLDQSRFQGGAMFGTPYYSRQGNDGEKDGEWRSEFNIPEPEEYPIEYYNRIVGAGQQTTIMGVAVPKLPPLQLCEEVVKVCEPGSGSALTGDGSGVNTGGNSGIGQGGCRPGLFTECDTSGDTDIGGGNGNNGGLDPVGTIRNTTTTGGVPSTSSSSSSATPLPSVTTPAPPTGGDTLNKLF